MKKMMIVLAVGAVLFQAGATQYSKLAIITAAKSAGKWDGLKSWIQQAGYYDEWLVASYLSDEYPQYPAITNAIVSAGVATADELAAILKASKDTAIPDVVLNRRYACDVASERGRVSWHGKRVGGPVEDMERQVQIYTYEDGTKFEIPFTKAKALTVEARFELERKRKAEAEAKRLAQLPPGLQDVERQRQENASKTNEVTVNYGPGVR